MEESSEGERRRGGKGSTFLSPLLNPSGGKKGGKKEGYGG